MDPKVKREEKPKRPSTLVRLKYKGITLECVNYSFKAKLARELKPDLRLNEMDNIIQVDLEDFQNRDLN